MSNPARPGANGIDDEADHGAPAAVSVPEPRSVPVRPADNTITAIMPIIAPWPDAGQPAVGPESEPVSAPAMFEPSATVQPATPIEPEFAADPVSKPVVVAELPESGDPLTEAALPEVPDMLDMLGGRESPVAAVDVDAWSGSTDLVRQGPAAIAEDSWDDLPLPVVPRAGPGRRRMEAPSPRVWVAVVAVLIGLGAIAAVPFALSSPDRPHSDNPVSLPTALDEPPPGFVPNPVDPASAAPVPAGGVATPAATPRHTSTQTNAAIPGGGQTAQAAPSTTTATNPPVPPPFTTLTIEAETGTRTGSATIWDGYPNASGGQLVRNVGNWGGTPGTVTLDGLVFPNEADYAITIYYVHPDGELNRSAIVTVSGVAGVNVSFTGNSDCCLTKVITIHIPAGTRSLKIENPDSHAPSIDKVVLTRV